MQYLCLIYEAESLMAQRDDQENQQIMSDYFAFTDDIKTSGHFIGGEALMPTETATTVRIRDGQVATTDGPFAETKEQLGGFYFIEANSLEDAIDIAAKIPSAKYGSIEVRPVMKFD